MDSDASFIQLLRDKDAIIDQLNAHARVLDLRQWNAVTDVFTEDVVANYGGIDQCGVVAVEEMIRSHLGGCGPSQHLLSNYHVSVDGDFAESCCYARILHAGLAEQNQSAFEVWCEFRDKWRRTKKGWRIYRRAQFAMHFSGDMSVLKPEA